LKKQVFAVFQKQFNLALFPDNFLLNRKKVNNHEGFRASDSLNFAIYPDNFPVSRELGGKEM